MFRIIENTSHTAASCAYHLPATIYQLSSTSYHLPAIIYQLSSPAIIYQLSSPIHTKGPIWKSLTRNNNNKNVWEFSGKMSGEWTINRKNCKTERIRVGRKMREETGKRNQMTVLRFQTGVRHQKSPASLWGPTTLNRKKKCTKRINIWSKDSENNPNSEQLSKLC